MKRHGYYCRTRRVGNISRSRSCIACAKGKARCDNRRPECSRCLAKAVECQYGATPPTKPALRAPPESIVVDGVRNSEHISDAELPDLNNHQEGGDDNFMLLNEPPIVADLDFTTTGADHFDWEAPDVDFSMLLSSPDITEQAEDALLPSNSLTYQPGPQGLSIGHNAKMQGIISSLNVSIFSNPSYAPAWSMVLRPNMQSGPQRIHSLIFHTLKSYPLMMPQHGSLPPFIHPSLMSSAEDDPNTEPLKNCISLVHMISRDRGSRKLFWKNVRMECERLAAEVLSPLL